MEDGDAHRALYRLDNFNDLPKAVSPKSPLGDEGVVGIIPHRPPHLLN
jgi:hypothetical protein